MNQYWVRLLHLILFKDTEQVPIFDLSVTYRVVGIEHIPVQL